MTARAAIYSRYSSDSQRRTSIDDQVAAARRWAAGQDGLQVVAQYSDEELSGAMPVDRRPGGAALMQAARRGEFGVLVLESLDRLSRNLGDQERVVELLEYLDVRVVGLHDGYDSGREGRELERGMRGLINSQYLRDLGKKTHRGLAGQFARGLHVGGISYGYRSEAVDGGRRLVIDETQAEVVREVFRRYAEGESTRVIVHDLNRRGVPGPRGGTWAVSALSVSIERELGLLHNTLYTGTETWNRRRWVKDPTTGRRRYVERPRDEWQVRQMPHLRIVDEDTWQHAQRRLAAGQGTRGRRGKGASPKTLLAGVLRCGRCGGPMIAVDARRYGCNVRQDRGPSVCAGVVVPRPAIEARLIGELRAELLAGDAMAELQSLVRDAVRRQMRASTEADQARRARLAALEGEIGRLVDAVAALGLSGALAARLQAAEAERATLLASAPREGAAAGVEAVIARAQASIRGQLMALRDVLDSHADRDRSRQLLAELLGTVVIGHDEEAGEVYAELEEPAERLMWKSVAGGEPATLSGVVAGARFELATFGL